MPVIKDRSFIFTGTTKGVLFCYEFVDNKINEMCSLQLHQSRITCLRFYKYKLIYNIIITSSLDSTFCITLFFDNTLHLIHQEHFHSSDVKCCCTISTKGRIATGGADQVAVLWKINPLIKQYLKQNNLE